MRPNTTYKKAEVELKYFSLLVDYKIGLIYLFHPYVGSPLYWELTTWLSSISCHRHLDTTPSMTRQLIPPLPTHLQLLPSGTFFNFQPISCSLLFF